MRQTISFRDDGGAINNGEVSILLKNVPITSAKQILSTLADKIEEMYADFYVDSQVDIQYPDRVHDLILRSLSDARVRQTRTPREQ